MNGESLYFESDGIFSVYATAFTAADMRRFHIIITKFDDRNWNQFDIISERLMPITTACDFEAVREAIRMFDATLEAQRNE